MYKKKWSLSVRDKVESKHKNRPVNPAHTPTNQANTRYRIFTAVRETPRTQEVLLQDAKEVKLLKTIEHILPKLTSCCLQKNPQYPAACFS